MSVSSTPESDIPARVSIESSRSISGLGRSCVQMLKSQIDNKELRSRVSQSESTINNLRNQLKQKENEIRRKEEQVRSLSEKMRSIRKGEEENKEAVVILQNKCSKLQQDNQDLNSQLKKRNDEVQVLLQQCQSREDALSESSELRAVNMALSQQMEEYKLLQINSDDNSVVERLRMELDKSKRENRRQKDQIAKLQKDNASVADTCAKSLQKIQDLTVRKAESEQQLRCDAQHAVLQMEQVRLSNSKEVRDLKEDLICKRVRLEELEKTTVQLRRLHAQATEKLVHEQENRVQALEVEHSERLQKFETEYNETLNRMQSKMEEKNKVISKLQFEVACYMEDVMTLTANLDHYQGQRSLTESQNDKVMDLQQECDILRELLATKDSSLAELTSSVARLESTVNELYIAFESCQRELNIQQEKAFDVEKGLRESICILKSDVDTARSLFQEELDQSIVTIVKLESQIAKQQVDIFQLQEANNASSSKDNAIRALPVDLAKASDELELATDTLAKECDALKDTLAVRDARIAEMTSQLASMELHLESTKQKQCLALERQHREMDSQQQLAAAIEKGLRDSLSAVTSEAAATCRQLQVALDDANTTTAALETQLATQQEITLQLQKAQSVVSTKDSTFRSLQSDLAKAIDDLKRETKSKTKLDEECDALRNKLQVIQKRSEEEDNSYRAILNEKEGQINSLEKVLQEHEQTRDKLANNCNAFSDMLEARNAMIAEMTARLANLEAEQSLALEFHLREMNSQKQSAAELEKRLRASLSAVTNQADASHQQLQEALDEARTIIVALQSQMEAQQEKQLQVDHMREKEVYELREMLKVAEQRVQSLESELKEISFSRDKNKLSLSNQIDNLSDELDRLQTRLAIKEDEIRDLTLVDLVESEETISSLKLQISTLEVDQSRAATTIKTLEEELEQCKAHANDCKQRLSSTSADSQHIIDHLQHSVAELQKQLQTRETGHQALEEKSRMLDASFSNLKRKNSLYEQRERILRDERDQLRALEQEWNSERSKLGKSNEDLQGQVKMLEGMLLDTNRSAAIANELVCELEEKLNDRAAILSEMVQINKNMDLELAKEKSRAQVAEESLAKLKQDLAARVDEVSRLTKDLQRKEDHFREVAHQERLKRDIAEAELRLVQSQLANVRQDNKINADLQKENTELKDKVKRQDGLLKRKMAETRILRDRKYPTNLKDVVATPARGFSTTSKLPRGSNRSTLSDMSSLSQEENWDLDSMY